MAQTWPQFGSNKYTSKSIFKLSLKHYACQVEEHHLMSNYLDHMRAMVGPYKGHIGAMFWLFLLYICFQMPNMAQIFIEESCMPSRRIPISIGTISEPCFGYFYNIFASRCLKWLKFSLESHASQIGEYH